ncbi:transglycosylase SLT domain-containing protein [Streptomyces odontomachi]|uniref:transglycosylase SLT domain-containing protein n=1 Tax=Streptomyces odontomachi TaxID=2944940 RepID=UPI00210B5247|nr:transglycosylase SLT domain-containing protein [Streptomyces sp. ODS25]
MTAVTTTARFRKYTVAGIVTAGAATAIATLAPAPAHAATPAPTHATASVSTATVADKAGKGDKGDAKGDKKAGAKSTQQKQSTKVAKLVAHGKKTYGNDLDGWIKTALDVMHAKHIPGSYHGIHKNIIRESGGNPVAQNNWDINAQNGVPSKGLLQVIQPTFDTYHVKGTKNSLTDPVANIVAACNYAADRYGSMDNVNSAY